MKRIFLLIAMFALAIPALASPVSAEPASVVISEIFPDPAGSDLMAEFIEIENEGNVAVSIEGWYISDQDGAVDFTFPDISLNPGERAVIYSGNTSFRWSGGYEFFMNRSRSVLNNDGDDVSLFDSEGNLLDYVAYGNGSFVDPPEEGEWPVLPIPETGLSFDRDGSGSWFQAMPTPGLRNPENAGDMELSAIYPVARYSDEFFAVKNIGAYDADISGYMLTDGEGKIYLPPGTVVHPGDEMYITQNASGFLSEMGFLPDMEYSDCYTPSSFPQMSNEGDSMALCSPFGSEISEVSYSGDSIPPKGYFLEFENDTWLRRKAGWSYLPPLNISFQGEVIPYSSPENSFPVLAGLIDSSSDSILINTYSFEDTEFAGHLISAMRRGVRVSLLVEGRPVGGVSPDEKEVLGMLNHAGASIRIKNSTDRYRYDHAKYMVIDGEWAVVQSENLNPDALRENRTWGNRGWGIALRSRDAAEYLKRIFMHDSDLNFSDIERYNGYSKHEISTASSAMPENMNITCNLSLLSGPDNGISEVIDSINSAKKTVFVEQFYITPTWRYGDEEIQSPLMSALLSAARRGCEVRVLLDGEYYNIDNDNDNDEVAGQLNAIAEREGLNMEARVIDSKSHELVKVHNKGMIIDGNKTLISSFNWGQNSFTNNREMAVLIDSAPVSKYYTKLFMQDWKEDMVLPRAAISGSVAMYVNESSGFVSSSTDNIGIACTEWYLDGRFMSSNKTVELNFTETGTHILSLKVSDTEGNSNSTSIEIIVMKIPPLPRKDSHEADDGTLSSITTPASPENPEPQTEEPVHESPSHGAYRYYLLVIPAAFILAAAARISREKRHS